MVVGLGFASSSEREDAGELRFVRMENQIQLASVAALLRSRQGLHHAWTYKRHIFLTAPVQGNQ
jgi:hypothetical protein